ncbi:small, acid-soluble spore protein, alpha/beta type [Hathewaya histolytica]|uniref:Small, acid-soluble spore proteins, alpha/beta type n=1 Tax=Hathewaya histolytica TaxID=1498 RepID=A0A4U9RPS9_HATHI|nr:small, acid-soluble spore protein, alpha/beta type [Hathewaya histolytica]VTQ94324.1 Small, acid-soluble spore proteins, alpha/beta type [Hathewaya histolytica]
MSHKNNKNSKQNKKVSQKTRTELEKMKVETANEIGVNNESKKLGKTSGEGAKRNR